MPSAVLLRRIFGQIDISGDGYISVAELRGAMEKGGKNLSDSQLDSIMRQVDSNSDGQISFEEFKEFYKLYEKAGNSSELQLLFDVTETIAAPFKVTFNAIGGLAGGLAGGIKLPGMGGAPPPRAAASESGANADRPAKYGGGTARQGVQGMGAAIFGKKKANVAEMTFNKHKSSSNMTGELSMSEVQRLCEEKLRDREMLKEGEPIDPTRLSLFVKLIDIDGNGHISAAEFETWWMEGDAARWGIFEMDDKKAKRMWSVVNFFESFGASNGALSGDGLHRMFLCLKGRNLIKPTYGGNERTYERFLQDVDMDFDGRVQLPELSEWMKREMGDKAPSMPTEEELSVELPVE